MTLVITSNLRLTYTVCLGAAQYVELLAVGCSAI